MAHHTCLFTAAACLLGATAAAAQHLLLPFSQHTSIASIPKLSTRASSDQFALTSYEYAYVVNVTVGTPAQKLSLLIDPSSGDTWVPDANTEECSPQWYYKKLSAADDEEPSDYKIPASECLWGSFNKSLSSTYLPPNIAYSSFSAESSDGTYVSGNNFTDKLVVGDVELDDYSMGLVDSARMWIGRLGLGFNASIIPSGTEGGVYANVMDRMISSGKMVSRAYSIWLDDAEGTSGSLLFGAVDQARFTGELVRLGENVGSSSSSSSSSYSYSYSSYLGLGTTVSRINGTTGSGSALPAPHSNDFPFSVTVSPGDLFSYLPEVEAQQIASIAGATYNDTSYYYTIPCDAGKSNSAQFVFELGGTGGPTLNVETADLVLPSGVIGIELGSELGLNGTNTCLFGIQQYYSSSSSSSSSDGSYTLGSSLLRRSYLVFDLANLEIAVAPVKFPSGSASPSPTIVAFESYGAHAPSATFFCSSSDCGAQTTGSGYGSGSGSGYGSGYGSGQDPESDSSDPDIQHWKQVAIGVGVTFGTLALVAAVAVTIVCVRLRRGVAAEGKEADVEGAEARPAEMPENAAAATQQGAAGARTPVALPPGTLPVIQERQEEQAVAHAQAPQLPALGTQLGRPLTPPGPASSDRASIAVSALSDEPQPGTQAESHAAHDGPAASEPEDAPAVPRSPKGKGKEVDRSSGDN